jgi:hypothetical protein
MYDRSPILWRELPSEVNPWGLRFSRLLDMANDSHLFRTREELEAEGWTLLGNRFRRHGREMLPLYEAKMLHQFNHRHSDYTDADEFNEGSILPPLSSERLSDPNDLALPYYWVPREDVQEALNGYERSWFIGWRDICRSTDFRTHISAVCPRAGYGDKWMLVLSDVDPKLLACMVADHSSFAQDYATRQKLGGTSLKYFTKRQLPTFPPESYEQATPWAGGTLENWILPRVVELTYTAWDMRPFAKDCGYNSPPFRWNEERRFWLRCELDAAFFHLYLGDAQAWRQRRAPLVNVFATPRNAVAYIMNTFSILKRKDVKTFGRFRTEEAVLDIYDAIAKGHSDGNLYETHLSPAPADVRLTHPPFAGVPLVVPNGSRAPLLPADYVLLVILTTLEVSRGEIETDTLLTVCKLLALPDQLAKAGTESHGSVAADWRSRFCDTLDAKLFLPTLRDLVERGAVKLVPSRSGSRTAWIDQSGFRMDLEIEFDVRFALEVADNMSKREMEAIPDVATAEELRPLYSTA